MLCSLLTVGEGSKHMGGVCPDAGGPSPESHCVNMDQHRTQNQQGVLQTQRSEVTLTGADPAEEFRSQI